MEAIKQAAATAQANAAAAQANTNNERLRAITANAASTAEAARDLEEGFPNVERMKGLLVELAVLVMPVEPGLEAEPEGVV